MIGIEAIATYIPQARENNLEKCYKFDMEPAFVLEKIGAKYTSRAGGEELASNMCISAFSALQERNAVDVGTIDCIIVCTQNPDNGGLPHVAARVHGAIGCADRCASFDVGLGCSGYVYSLSIACSFMESNGLKQGLLFTADPYSKIVDPEDRNTSLLFGDAATVTLLSHRGCWIPKHFLFGTRGSGAASLQKKDGKLEMNGRAVFTFSATVVPAQIAELLQKQELAPNDIDMYFLHQGSRYIVDTITERLKVERGRVPVGLEEQGNTVSSSIPLMLCPFIDRPDLNRFVLSGFGVGLSWASCILERVHEPKKST